MSRFNDSERYVVTGMGMVSPIGNDPEAAWQAALKGQHGVVYARDSLLAGYESLPTYVAAPVKDFDLLDDPSFAGNKKEIRSKWDLSQQFILAAAGQALRQARLSSFDRVKIEEHGIDPHRVGVYVGTGIGGAHHMADAGVILEAERVEYLRALEEKDEELTAGLIGGTRLNPKLILKALPGRVAATPSMVFGAKAFWDGVLRECASGNGAIISGIEALKLGKADVVLAGGVEGEITPVTTGLFAAAHAVSKNRDPNAASRPLDERRDGLVMGQGAAALTLEKMDNALDRGAPILAEIVAYSQNADAMHETEPDPANVVRCLHEALSQLDRPVTKLKNVGINMHGTSTPFGDKSEMNAIRGGLAPRQLRSITAIKSVTGHMFGSAGAAEAVMSVMQTRDGLTPPINNLETPIDETRGYRHLMSGTEVIEGDLDLVVNNSFGFGGNNAVTIFARPR